MQPPLALHASNLRIVGLDEDPWDRLGVRLQSLLGEPTLFTPLRELSEWYWEACVEEADEPDAAALLSSPLARANYNAIALFDADGGDARPPATRLLLQEGIPEEERRMLLRALESRPRLLQVEPRTAAGLRPLLDLVTGHRVHVPLGSWPLTLQAGDRIVGRVLGAGHFGHWVGPVLPLPMGTPDDLLVEVQQDLAQLARTPDLARRAATERFLVDLHHQWFSRVFVPTQQRDRQDRIKHVRFDLLTGRVRTSG